MGGGETNMHLVSESLVCYRCKINKADLKWEKKKKKSRAKRKEGVGVNGKLRYFKQGCLDLALDVSSAEGAQRDAEGLPYGVQVVLHHLRSRVVRKRGTRSRSEKSGRRRRFRGKDGRTKRTSVL